MRDLDDLVYTHDDGTRFTWEELLEDCRGNETYAEHLLGRMEGYYPSTYMMEDFLDGEIIELENTYIITGGKGNKRPRNVLFGEHAEKFWEDTYNIETGAKTGKQYENIGGYWKDGTIWMAFDYTNGDDCFQEEFADEEEAIKYASGIMAQTISGYKI